MAKSPVAGDSACTSSSPIVLYYFYRIYGLLMIVSLYHVLINVYECMSLFHSLKIKDSITWKKLPCIHIWSSCNLVSDHRNKCSQTLIGFESKINSCPQTYILILFIRHSSIKFQNGLIKHRLASLKE